MVRWFIAAAIALTLCTASATADHPRDRSADFRAELAKAGHANKKALLVVFELEGCGQCAQLKRILAAQADVGRYYQRQFLSYSIDVGRPDPLTDFKGRTSSAPEFALDNRVVATPTLVFYDLEGYPVARFVGAPKDAAELLRLGHYVAEAAYEKLPFSQYRLAGAHGQ